VTKPAQDSRCRGVRLVNLRLAVPDTEPPTHQCTIPPLGQVITAELPILRATSDRALPDGRFAYIQYKLHLSATP